MVVNALIGWQRDGVDIAAAFQCSRPIWATSARTAPHWYFTAVPELMQLARPDSTPGRGAGHERPRAADGGILHRPAHRPARRQRQHDRRLPRHYFRLLLASPTQTGKKPSGLDIADLDAPLVAAFWITSNTNVGTRSAPATTGSLRSTPCSATPRYVIPNTPRRSSGCWRSPVKRCDRNLVTWLTAAEVDALLAAPDRTTWTGRRDHAMLVTAAQTGLRI